MLRIPDTLAGQSITINYPKSKKDLYEIRDFIGDSDYLAMDTESTGINCYKRGWELRTVQYGNGNMAFVIPARCRNLISWAVGRSTGPRSLLRLVGHNGPHDARCIDVYLGEVSGLRFSAETYIPSHHLDTRNQSEGGVGHGLKELGVAYVDRDCGKWEKALKVEFKNILIPIPGEVYKSGPRKGQQKVRKAKLSEGWSLIDPENPAYIAYAGADPIINWHVFHYLQPVIKEYYDLYQFDKRVQLATDRLQRRAIRLDVGYTERLSRAYQRRALKLRTNVLETYSCENVQSGDQVADTLIRLGVKLTRKTDSGKWKTDAELLRKIMAHDSTSDRAKDFIRKVLLIKQVEKRRAAYAETMLAERDENDRVHTSLNSLAARTSRMSASNPALQQLPTKDHSEEEFSDGTFDASVD